MSTERRSKPIPLPNELTQPFWTAAKENRLAIQKCNDCGYYNHPPKPLCDRCSSDNLTFATVSGRGKIYSYTLMHQKTIVGFEDEVPYLNVVIELDEQPKLFMITNLRGAGSDEVKIGHPVEVVFEKVNDDITLPQFRLGT